MESSGSRCPSSSSSPPSGPSGRRRGGGDEEGRPARPARSRPAPGRGLRYWEVGTAYRAERNYAGEHIMDMGRLSAYVQSLGYWSASLDLSVFGRTLDDRLTRSRSGAQYVGVITDPRATSTYGRRYLFAELDQTTLSLETRLNFTFNPRLSLQVYAQPYISSGDFGDPAELRAPRTYDFLVYGRGVGEVQRHEGSVTIYPEGIGGEAPSFSLPDGDFNLRSLRGNAVLRWECRPASLPAARRAPSFSCPPERTPSNTKDPMRRSMIVPAALLAAALGATPLSAQTHRETILSQLDVGAKRLETDGYRLDPATLPQDPVVGLLPDGGRVFLEISLQAGSSYFISGACDTDCDDLDLKLMDSEGKDVAEDIEEDDVPILMFVAPHSGRYMLSVSMASCSESLCYFGYRILKK